MGSLLRSKEMKLVRLYLQPEAAYPTIKILGEAGLIQFVDLNSHINSFQRPKVQEIKQCTEIERKLAFIEKQIVEEEEPFAKEIISSDEIESINKMEMENLDSEIERYHEDLKNMIVGLNEIYSQFIDLVELKHTITKSDIFFAQGDFEEDFHHNDHEKDTLLDNQHHARIFGDLGHIVGIINSTEVFTLERILWRVSRGNLLFKQEEIDEPIMDLKLKKKTPKTAFMVLFEGDVIGEKLTKYCQTFGAKLFEISESPRERYTLFEKTQEQIRETRLVLNKSKRRQLELLMETEKRLSHWKNKVKQEKAINHIINMLNFDTTKQCLIAEAWSPSNKINQVKIELKKASEDSGVIVPTVLEIINDEKKEKPTFFETNKFTTGFHGLVESYGTANYGEISPTPFSIITFPFLFAVMFGDLGHGSLLFLTAMIFILKEKKFGKQKLGELVEVLYNGRYILLLMGLFSMYTGLLYNETFSLPIDFFGSCWSPDKNDSNYHLVSHNCAYPFGVDPVWQNRKNELLYVNSLKMKLSVIIGVSHMTLGIVLNLLNAVHFKRYVDVWCGFLPQIIFFFSFFGYMVFLVILKWNIRWSNRSIQTQRHGVLLINTLIRFVISPGSVEHDMKIYPNQGIIQLILLFLVVIAIPWMLCPKPFILKNKAKKKMLKEKKLQHENRSLIENQAEPNDLFDESKYQLKHHDSNSDLELDINIDNQKVNEFPIANQKDEKKDETSHEEQFQMSEVFVEQAITTIEFVLGSISNTASYLRLWALSLAHSQLSKVFWQKLVLFPLTTYSWMVFIGFAIWVFITISVLMIMETFSALLHALRLHWVEFQNKFYKGEGIKFQPFSFEELTKEQTN
ncbi:v-type proton atpase subunit a [Anaeramoeba ignava]|uniref:V-type proton ATPase subunit a n=1 Tax=Anaeramoeba ignava TaxID=1746090 RepID=A0A9Q0LHZ9_ANAIG|nr:v-type proton atpase subunit a [Anaeramoeba ignava]